MGYCEVTDLMLGDLVVSVTVDQQTYVDGAAEEMDVAIGQVYETPIIPGNLSDASAKLLKKINRFLASGRLIMGLNIAGEDNGLHAYGSGMVKQALADLQMIVNGAFLLEGATRVAGADATTGPSVVNHDSESAVDAFEKRFMRGYDTGYWRPGTPA